VRRRDLLALVGGAAALAPFGATAQPGLPVIGYLSSRSAGAETPLRTGFLEGLEQAGFVVGRNVAIEYRYAEGSLMSPLLLKFDFASLNSPTRGGGLLRGNCGLYRFSLPLGAALSSARSGISQRFRRRA
jgi:hypothetical protein